MHRARPTTQRRFQWSAPSLPTSSGARLKNQTRSEEHTSELQSQSNLVCRLLLEKKKIFLTMFAVAFATIGVAYDNFPEILSDGEMAKRYLISFLFLAAGSLHLYALNDHLG